MNKTTDVLSFPSSSLEGARARPVAGEIAICAEIARENAESLGHPVANEVKILALHGILHLAGFDHERDKGEMARKEARLRRELKLEAGLIERTEPSFKAERRKRRIT
jgi:probable rRNA maturation factor